MCAGPKWTKGCIMNLNGHEQDTHSTVSPAEPQAGHQAPSCLVMVDLQNFDHFVSDCCGLNPFSVDVIGYVKALAASNGLNADDIRIYTGIHDQVREPVKHNKAHKRLTWMRSCGAKVYAQKLAYQVGALDGVVRPREKGIDVRIGCELIEAVSLGGVRRVLMLSHDKDMLAAVDVARTICSARHWDLNVYSPELQDISRLDTSRRAAYRGLPGTDRLEVRLDQLDRFGSPSERMTRNSAPNAASIGAMGPGAAAAGLPTPTRPPQAAPAQSYPCRMPS